MTESKKHKSRQRDVGLSSELQRETQLASIQAQTRRHFLRSMTGGLGSIFLGTMASRAAWASGLELSTDGTPRLDLKRDPRSPLSALPPQFAARAKRVIYLHMAGAPSQLELFEYKPELVKLDGQDCPASLLAGKRFAFITGVPKLMGPQYPFHQVDAHRSIQPCAGAIAGADRQRSTWLSFARIVGCVWPRHRESEFAWFHRVDLGWKYARRREATLGHWISAERLSGCAMPFSW